MMALQLHSLRSIIVFVILCVLPSASLAAEIVGKVTLSGKPAADLVISIEGLKLEGPPDAAIQVIDHRNLNFTPHVLVVRVGSTVHFQNSDGMPCRIYSISPTGMFVLGRHEDRPMTVTFDQPGVVEVRCADHHQIYAYIIVKENPYFAITDAKGRYRISGVSPGHHTIQAWYEGSVVKTQKIEVGQKKLTVDFRASLPQTRTPEEQPLAGSPADDATGANPSLTFLEDIR